MNGYFSDVNLPVFSDSQTARAWVRKGYCLMQSVSSDKLREVVTRANVWLRDHADHKPRVQTWNSREWGENPADFGRK